MKAYTDLSQSRKLAEILPIESADMQWLLEEDYGIVQIKEGLQDWGGDCTVPCWSLTALLELLELPTLEKNGIGKGKTGWMVTHYDVSGMRYDTTYYDNPIDACVSMIELLHGLKLL